MVPPSFVTESVACLRLQDAKDYDLSIFKDQVIVKQEKKSNKTCGDPLIKRERSSRTHYRRQTEHNLAHFSTNKHGRQASMAKQERIRSPTPPDSAPVRSTTGWKYTNSEKAYAIRYLKHKKGEKMNLTQLSDRLNKKARTVLCTCIDNLIRCQASSSFINFLENLHSQKSPRPHRR